MKYFCQCGCGQEVRIHTQNRKTRGWVKGEPFRFIKGHQCRGGGFGRYISPQGYVFISVPGHPRAKGTGTYVMEHLVVAEKALGRTLHGDEEVHHVNSDRTNNMENNLVICPDRAYHMLLHQRMRAKEITGNPNFKQCSLCALYDDPLDMKNSVNGRGCTYFMHQRYSANYKRCREYRNQKWRDKHSSAKASL